MTSVDDLLHQHRARIVKILDAVVAVAAVATIPVTVIQLKDEQNAAVIAVDWVIWLIFVTEYVVMLRLPPEEGGFDGSNQWDRRNWGDWRNWVSIAIIVLSFPGLVLLKFVRLVRVVRLARLGKIATVTTRAVGQTFGRRGVLYVFGFVVFAIVAGGAVMASLEPDVVGGQDVDDGIWWAAVTTIGTGLGEPWPDTAGGQAIALGLMLCGVAFVTTLAGSIAAYFLGGGDGERWAGLDRRLDEIQRAVGATESQETGSAPQKNSEG